MPEEIRAPAQRLENRKEKRLRQRIAQTFRLGRYQLHNRLTLILIAIIIPLLFAAILFVSDQAGNRIRESAVNQLRSSSQALHGNISLWLELNLASLEEMASLPDMVSMDPTRQEPYLDAMVNAYSHIYLVMTTGWDGMNIARSDDRPLQDYGNRLWQIGARNNLPLTFEVLVDEHTDIPALVAAVPIENELGTIVGVVMFASRLDEISQEVGAIPSGETGLAYIVDGQNRVVAHSNPDIAAELQDYDTYPPVSALRGDETGLVTFTDDDGIRWQAYVDVLPNNWGIVIQQQESELLSALRVFQGTSLIAVLIVAIVMGGVSSLTIQRALRPINTLTETATAIAAGDLSRTVQVQREDEIGLLAETFNSMTAQLRDLIGGLEQRVAERTRGLQAASEVSRATTSILDPEKLVEEVVNLIHDRFDLYYVGLFLLDQPGEFAELHAGTGEAGRQMLERNHRLRIGGDSMVGQCIDKGQARIALDVGEEAQRFDNPFLPETRSEMALPLRSRGRVIGAVSVQSSRAAAFDEADIAVMQTMADQVAVAIDNARLFVTTQAALEEMESTYQHYIGQAWFDYTGTRSISGYQHTDIGPVPLRQETMPEAEEAIDQRDLVVDRGEDGDGASKTRLVAPILLRDIPIGALGVTNADKEWDTEEIALVQAIAEQFALTAENLRLIEETQRRAAREQLTREITDKMRQATSVENIARIAIDELHKALRTSRTFVHLGVAAQRQEAEETE
jgi:GAF domain-containing protein/HAMP domain-containing protein